MTRQTVEVTHIQYRGWPDHGVPESPDKFLEVVERVEALRHQLPKETPYIQVHCSAGIGRSGVFIVVLIMLDKLRKKVGVIVYHFMFACAPQKGEKYKCAMCVALSVACLHARLLSTFDHAPFLAFVCFELSWLFVETAQGSGDCSCAS